MRTIRECWYGRLPLWLTYWVWGVSGNMSFVLVLALLLLAGRAGNPAALEWLWPVYLLSLAWFVFIFFAIWRSAGRYPGPPVWAWLARLGVVVGIARMTVEGLYLDALPAYLT